MLEDSRGLLCCGLALLGVAISFTFVPLLPEMLYVVQKAENIMGDNELNDKASGIYNTCYGIGTIIAPYIGGALKDWNGFRFLCDVMACSSFVFAIFFFIFNVGPTILCNLKPD